MFVLPGTLPLRNLVYESIIDNKLIDAEHTDADNYMENAFTQKQNKRRRRWIGHAYQILVAGKLRIVTGQNIHETRVGFFPKDVLGALCGMIVSTETGSDCIDSCVD